jgi:hypothetical protein
MKNWEKHVAKTPAVNPTRSTIGSPALSFCGVELWSHDWYFVDADHATRSVENGTRLQPCHSCLEEIKNVPALVAPNA